MKAKTFKTDKELLEFINGNDIQVISTHSTPQKIIQDKDDWDYDESYRLKVTLLYIEVNNENK